MSDPDELDVWWGSRRVGHLHRDALGRMGFRYEPQWLEGRNVAISSSLPLVSEPFAPEAMTAHRFFANLLPEGAARDLIVRELRSGGGDFELLRAIGGECAGALSILEPGRAPTADGRYRLLEHEDFERFVLTRGRVPRDGLATTRPRLSLAGAQDKCALRLADGRWLEPLGSAPSTHILKFESREFSNVLAYETFLTELARRIGLSVVDVELGTAKGRRYLSVRRYDRRLRDDGAVERLHQEDFCQALGIGHERKYESDGGPSFADCLGLLRAASVDPILDTERLLRWQMFNVVAGNSDGHAKNLSLLHDPESGIRLAPFYDLVCTRAIARVDTRLAFSIGGQRQPADLDVGHWHAFARACDIGRRFALGLLRRTLETTLEATGPTREAFEARHGPCPALQRVERVIAVQARRTWRALG